MENKKEQLKLASISKRAINFVVDSIASFILMSVLSALFYSDDMNNFGAFILILISFPGYYLFSEWKWGKTPAKFITKTSVIMTNGQKLNFNSVLVRTFCRYIPFDWISSIFYKQTIFWHDSLSETRVIDDK